MGHRLTTRSRSALCALLLVRAAASLQAHPEAGVPLPCPTPASADEVLSRINAARARGLPCRGSTAEPIGAPLRWSATLAAAAATQANEMAASRHMGHRDRRDHALRTRLSGQGYLYSMAYENVAYGYASLEAVVDAWLASASHCANLMNADMVELGLACSDASADGRPGTYRYWSLIVGAPQRVR